MSESIGKYLQKKVRKSGLEDQEVADFLSIAKSTVEKVYLVNDIYASRLMQFCGLLGEDLFLQFYYEKEPLKSMRNKEIEEWNKKIQALTSAIVSKEKSIKYLEDHVATQNKLIASLEDEVKRLKSMPSAKNKK